MPLDASRLLAAWEQGAAQPPAARALLLLEAAEPQFGCDGLEAMGVGERDARLMALRERWIGPDVECLGACPSCGERVELSFALAQLRIEHAPRDAVFEVDVDGRAWRLRLPNSGDLLALDGERDAAAARRRLLERCVRGTPAPADAASVAAWPESVVSRVEQRMAELDPQAEVLLDVQCPQCGHRSQAPFEIENYLWAELDAWAHQLLHDVHRLASAYGWREPDILALSPQRRRAYLELIG